MEENEILGIAERATTKLFSRHQWMRDEGLMDDCIQAGVLRVLQILEGKELNGGQAFWVAYNAGFREALYVVYERNVSPHKEGYIVSPSEIEAMVTFAIANMRFSTSIIISQYESQLVDFLLSTRKKRGKRGREASEKDFVILCMIEKGMMDKEIAEELGINVSYVKRRRVFFKRAFKEILEAGMTLEQAIAFNNQNQQPSTPMPKRDKQPISRFASDWDDDDDDDYDDWDDDDYDDVLSGSFLNRLLS